MDLSQDQLLEMIAQIAPNRYLQAVLIVVVFAVLAKIADMIMTRILKRLLKKTKFTLDDQLLDIFHKPIFVSIMLFGLALATGRLDFPVADRGTAPRAVRSVPAARLHVSAS